MWAREMIEGEVVSRPYVVYPLDPDWLAVADVVKKDGMPALALPRPIPRAALKPDGDVRERLAAERRVIRDGQIDSADLPSHYPPTRAQVPYAKLALALEEVVRKMQAGDYPGLRPGDFDAVIRDADFDLETVGTLPPPQYRGRPINNTAPVEPEPEPERRPRRGTACRCERPVCYTDEDGDTRCNSCGLAVARRLGDVN